MSMPHDDRSKKPDEITGRQEHEAKLAALRELLDASIAAGGHVSDSELDAALEETARELAKEGY